MGTGKAVQMACEKLRDALIDVGAKHFAVQAGSIDIVDGQIRCGDDRFIDLKDAAALLQDEGLPLLYESEFQWRGEAPTILYGYNAGLVELAVNETTGQVRLDHVVNISDPGTVINPLALEGQVDGGIGFGCGFALTERFHPDRPPTFEGYGLPTTKLAPARVTRLFAGGRCERGPFGAKSAGEMPGISPIPAIINGIANATGARVFDIPATPDRVLAAIAARP